LRLAELPEAVWGYPREVSREELLRVHTADYLARLDALEGKSGHLDADTPLSAGSVKAAYLAAGAAIGAVECVVAGESRTALALVRPPGHHAEAGRGMGFCVLNNVAVAVAHAVAALGAARVLIVDWDVHHGNGTQHVFEARREVLFFSTHRWPFYPGTGAVDETGVGAGLGFTVNVPLPPGMGDADYVAVFRETLLPVAERFAPDLVVVSAGFDAHARDPLGGMAMSTAGFAALCGLVKGIADRHAGGRLVLVLEGGYNLDGLASSVLACARVMIGEPAPTIAESAAAPARAAIARVQQIRDRG
jgi:acetoin utilization deacetylase AcuC-like enzyme